MGDNSKGIAKNIVTSPQIIKFAVNVKVEKCDDDSENKNDPVEEVVNDGGTFSMDECGVNISEPIGIDTEDLGKKYAIRKILASNEKGINNGLVPVKQYTITRTSILKAVEEQAKENTSLADKYLDIAVRNFYGECRDTPKTFHEKLIYDAFERWKDWYETCPGFRDSPLLYMCYICKMGWWRLHPFREHIKSHGENTFKIRTLPRDHEFYVGAFSNRVLRPIDLKIFLNCSKCGRPAKYHNFRRQTAKYKCEGCNIVFFTCNKLVEHEGICKLYMKMKCDKLGVEMTSDLKTCPVCFRYCLTQTELDAHMIDRHSVHSDDPILMQAKLCSACNTKYHIYKFHDCPGRYKNIKCDFCFRKFITKAFQYMHVQFSKKLVKCTVCDKSMHQCMLLEHMLHHSKNYTLVPWCSKCKNNLLHIRSSFYKNHMKSHGRWVDKKRWGAKMLVPTKCITGEIVHSETVLNIPEKDLEDFMNGLEDDGSNSKEDDDDDVIILDDVGPLPVVPNESEECDIYTLQAQLDAEIQKDVEMEAAISKVFKASNCYQRFMEKETEEPLEDNLYDDDDDDLILLNNSEEVTIISDSEDDNENENSKEFVEDNIKIVNSKEREECNTNRNTKVKEEPKDNTNISSRKDGTIEAHPEHNAKADTLIAKDKSVVENYNVVEEAHSGRTITVKREKQDDTRCPLNEDSTTELRTNMKEKLNHDNIRVSRPGNGTYASYLQDEDSSLRHSIEVKEEPGDASCLQDAEFNWHHSPEVKVEPEDELIMSLSSDVSNASFPQDVECNLNHTTEVKEEPTDDIVMLDLGDEDALHPQEVHYDKVNKIGVKDSRCDATLSSGKNKRLAKNNGTENLKSNIVTGEEPVSDKMNSGEPIVENDDVSIVNVEIFYACKKCQFRGSYKEYIEHITSSCVAMSFYCSTCTTAFPTLKLYAHHLTQHNYDFLTCPNCKQQFKEVSRLCAHIKLHLRNFYMKSQNVQNIDLSPSQKNNILQCIECMKIIKPEQIFIHWDLHLKMKNNKEIADDDEDSYDETEMNAVLTKKVLEMLVIKEKWNMERRCIVCNKTFARRNECKRHLIMHLLLQALRSKVKHKNQLRCQLCGTDQNNPTQYKEHMRGHASMTIYKCQLCAKTFSDSSNCSKHMKVHNLYSCICDKCGGKFRSKKCLIKHLQLHDSRPPVTCLQCDMSFCTESKLKKHFKLKHMRGFSSFVCIICKKRFGSLKDKWDHMWLEHQERKIEADCPLCNKEFRKFRDVKQHMKAVHSLHLRPNSLSDKLAKLKRDYECEK